MLQRDYFRTPEYVRESMCVLDGWTSSVRRHLTYKYPDRTTEEIDQKIKSIRASRQINPTIARIHFPEPGRPVKQQIDALAHVEEINGLITAPSGNSYLNPDVKESFIRTTLIDNKKARSGYKKLMLAAKEAGDIGKMKRFNNLQSSAKIKNNSVPGMMQSEFNIINDSSGFNAITSVSRLFVRSAYGHGERMLSGNLYIPSYDDALSYIYTMLEVMPSTTTDVILNHNLVTPSAQTVCDWIVYQVSQYGRGREHRKGLYQILKQLSPAQLTFVYCGGSLHNLIQLNPEFFRSWINRSFAHDTVKIDPEQSPKDLFKLEATLSVLVRSPNTDRLGISPKGKLNTLDEALENNPDGIRFLTALGVQMERHIDEIGDIIETFIRIEADVPQPYYNKRLVRDAVIGCDTDSNIFTTSKIVQMYHQLEDGRMVFNRKTYEVNALVVYFLSRSIEHVFARMSTNLGAHSNDRDQISMKNEYLFMVFGRTNIAKHYAALILQQEGKLLPEPELEAKGVGLIGSTRAGSITAGLKTFIQKYFEKIIETDAQLRAEDMLNEVADLERDLLKKFTSGDLSMLTISSIKNAPSNPSYFYYELWEEVFKPEYNSNIVLPTRMFKVPVIGEDGLFSNPAFVEYTQKKYPGIYKRLDKFIKNKGRYPSFFLIPYGFETLPKFFLPWIDARRMVFDNLSPYYLFLSSFGINTSWRKNDLLISDFR